MEEVLKLLNEKIDNKEIASFSIKYDRVGQCERVEVEVNKLKETTINLNIENYHNENQTSMEQIAKELATQSKKVSLY